MKGYPPFLDQVHEHCPKAASIYTRIWREKNSSNVVNYSKKQITEEYGIAWKTFKSEIMMLQREKVIKLSIDKKNEKIKITLILKPKNEKAA